MRHEPPELPPDLVAAALRAGWGIDAAEVRYVPVGAGSHHWAVRAGAGRWFATADQLSHSVHYVQPAGAGIAGADDSALSAARDAAFAGLLGALRTAASLRDAGRDFVVAPLPDRCGAPVRRVGADWALAVYPYLEGEPAGDGPWSDPADRERVARMVAAVHTSPAPDSIPRWSTDIQARAELHTALAEVGAPWGTGPLAEPARQLLAPSVDGVKAMLTAYDELVASALDGDDEWVVTHGEPHSRNLVRLGDGRLLLIDWDTVALAPRERDLEPLVPGGAGDPAWAAYQDVVGRRELRTDRIRLFRLRWDLTDIALYARDLRTPHTGTADDRRALHALTVYLPVDRRWPDLAPPS